MRKVFIMLLLTVPMGTISVMGQSKKTAGKESFGTKVNKFFSKAKTDLEQAGHDLGNAIGFDDRVEGRTEDVKVNGVYYMPVYEANLYRGEDASELTSVCRSLFMRKYPNASVVSVALPQTEWQSETLKEKGKVTGYSQTMYCYILAKDGNDGYINARYVFERTKKVGEAYQKVNGKYPKWERTDAIPNAAYGQLVK